VDGFCGGSLDSDRPCGAAVLAQGLGVWALGFVLFDIVSTLKGYVGGYSVWIDGMDLFAYRDL
jgi:hypothetical protein